MEPIRISICLKEKEDRILTQQARLQDRSKSYIIRRLIDDAFPETEKADDDSAA
jgi:hypothetical protein